MVQLKSNHFKPLFLEATRRGKAINLATDVVHSEQSENISLLFILLCITTAASPTVEQNAKHCVTFHTSLVNIFFCKCFSFYNSQCGSCLENLSS